MTGTMPAAVYQGHQTVTVERLPIPEAGVGSLEELDEYLARAQRYRDKDARVDIIDRQVEEHPGITLTSFYVGYLLPMMVEVQHFAFGAPTAP